MRQNDKYIKISTQPGDPNAGQKAELAGLEQRNGHRGGARR
jgi:hypothetical protein